MRRTILLAATLPLLMLCAAQAAPPAKPEVAAFAERALRDNCDPDAPGMAVLVARGEQVLYRGACGRASLELGVPLSPEHVFRIASVTKQFAAAGVLRLVDEGRLSLDDPLARFLPEYPNAGDITVGMLLNHTSGIRSYTDMPEVMEGAIGKDVTTAQLIDSFKDAEPEFAPGEGYRYNNSAYVLAGAVIEAVTGQSWHAYLHEAFFAPLGMAHTGNGDPAGAVIAGHVGGYTRNGGQWAQARQISMTQPHAAGALVSTVDDLHRWNRALHRDGLLAADSYRRMTVPEGAAADSGYGYGIVAETLRAEPMLQHGGGVFGFSSYLLYLPESAVTVAVLYNADSGRPGMLGTGRIARLLAAQAIGKPYPEAKDIGIDAATLGQYEGVYRIDAGSARVVRVVDGRLTSQRTGGPAFALIPVAEDGFVFEDSFSRVVFERDGAGAVNAMRFFPEDEGEGEVVARSEEPLPAAREQVRLPREALERVAGEYVFQNMVMTVFLDDDVLKAQLSGQPAFEIFAETPSRFFFTVVEATLEFTPDEGPATSVILRQGGAVLEFERRQ